MDRPGSEYLYSSVDNYSDIKMDFFGGAASDFFGGNAGGMFDSLKDQFMKQMDDRKREQKSRYGRTVSGRESRKEKKDPFAGLMKQNYEEVKKTCLEEGILFEDPEFLAEDSSIFFSQEPPRAFEWLRPSVSQFNTVVVF